LQDQGNEEEDEIRENPFSPTGVNAKLTAGFETIGWTKHRGACLDIDDEEPMRRRYGLSSKGRKPAIQTMECESMMPCDQTGLVKDRVAVEIQFGSYSRLGYDLFANHLGHFVSDIIDVGIEILPMEKLERKMWSNGPYYESDLLRVSKLGRGIPTVPLVLIGVLP